MKIVALSILVAGLAVYAWRDWFKALCGLILLMAIVEHPGMPKQMAGIQGLNPWNLLMASILLSWLRQRHREGLTWDMPRWITSLLLLYLLAIVLSFVRMIGDQSSLEGSLFEGSSNLTLVSEFMINSVKWAIPGMLLFHGCNTRGRLRLAVACIALFYILLAAQVARCTSPGALVGQSNIHEGRRRIEKRTGYNAVNMATILAGGSWAVLSTTMVVRRRRYRLLLMLAALGIVYGQALTAGRMSYLAWGVTGLTMCVLRWRWLLLVAPLVPVIAMMALPGVADRVMEGFGQRGASGAVETDEYEVTSGRAEVWPHVIDKIQESPLLGYGRLAMIRAGIQANLAEGVDEGFAHPHNAYLEFQLECGIVGMLPVLAFYVAIVVMAARLFRDRNDPWKAAAGGIALAVVLSLLVASMGSHHFYPREEAVGTWAAIGLMLRMWLPRNHVRVGYRLETRSWPTAAV